MHHLDHESISWIQVQMQHSSEFDKDSQLKLIFTYFNSC